MTVALCTYNPDPQRLERTLVGLDRQTLSRESCEFFVVDNRSDPPVEALDPVRRRNLRVLREERPGLTAARERAAQEAEADIIVFPDDDTVLDPDYLQAALELMRDADIGMLSGNIEPEYAVPPARWFQRFEESLAIRRVQGVGPHFAEAGVYSSRLPVGAGCVIRTSVLREHVASLQSTGRIEGRKGAELTAGEDLDIGLFAQSRGLRVGTSGRLRVTHLIPGVRVSEAYVTRLLVGAMRSSVALEAKWRRAGDAPLFDYLHVSPWIVRLKIVMYGALAWLPQYRVRLAVQRELLRVLPSVRPA